ncbi:MAG: tRNA pseudouridine(55) synthase TruB [Lachnospira sp.]
MNGIINVYKEKGFTSHDVVAKLRGILHIKKIGHTGTLDPDAVGVLPVCIGKGTKLCGMITDWGKTYEVVMLLGTVTDTLDTSGTIIKSSEVNVTELDIMDACESFVGEYEQIPPMYSAVKVGGKKLYELAREGKEIERKPRKVRIDSIRINDIDLDGKVKTVTMTVDCSKGTYIRSLCDDIGRKLGCGACMKELKRTRVGEFFIDDTLTLNQIAACVLKGEINDFIKPVDEVFEGYPKAYSKEEFDILLHNGSKLGTDSLENSDSENISEIEKIRLYDSHGIFVGIYRYEDGLLIPEKMFYESDN